MLIKRAFRVLLMILDLSVWGNKQARWVGYSTLDAYWAGDIVFFDLVDDA